MSGRDGDHVTEACDFQIDTQIIVSQFGWNPDGLIVAEFEDAGNTKSLRG